MVDVKKDFMKEFDALLKKYDVKIEVEESWAGRLNLIANFLTLYVELDLGESYDGN